MHMPIKIIVWLDEKKNIIIIIKDKTDDISKPKIKGSTRQ